MLPSKLQQKRALIANVKYSAQQNTMCHVRKRAPKNKREEESRHFMRRPLNPTKLFKKKFTWKDLLLLLYIQICCNIHNFHSISLDSYVEYEERELVEVCKDNMSFECRAHLEKLDIIKLDRKSTRLNSSHSS